VSGWTTAGAPAKLNLALVVGPLRDDGKHEVVTLLERLSLEDTVAVRRASEMRVTGFAEDSLVGAALEVVGQASAGDACFEARIEKRIPVAAGLGGGSSDAAAALLLANGLLDEPLSDGVLHRLAAGLGADVPFFLRPGPQLATGDGTTLEPTAVPRDYSVVLALPYGAAKASTADVYTAFDARRGHVGFDERRAGLLHALEECAGVDDLARLPPCAPRAAARRWPRVLGLRQRLAKDAIPGRLGWHRLAARARRSRPYACRADDLARRICAR